MANDGSKKSRIRGFCWDDRWIFWLGNIGMYKINVRSGRYILEKGSLLAYFNLVPTHMGYFQSWLIFNTNDTSWKNSKTFMLAFFCAVSKQKMQSKANAEKRFPICQEITNGVVEMALFNFRNAISKGTYSLEIPWGIDALRPFERIDLTTQFRKDYISLHGKIDPHHYQLIDAYFSLVMARNTTGLHQFARVLKGCQCLARAGEENLNGPP